MIKEAIILGIIEGLTEFLPISSTGHLIIIHDKLNLNLPNAETFSIAIQLGAILAVLMLYWDVFKPFLSLKNWRSREASRIAIAISPALLLGAFTHSLIKAHLFSSNTVAIGLGIGAIIMLWAERKYSRSPQPHGTEEKFSLSEISTKQALIVGIAQCAALWPGTSRSGATIVGGLISGLSLDKATQFSFIIAVPVMIAAVSYDLMKSAAALSITDLQLIGIGFFTAWLIATLSILSFLKLLSKIKLTPFAIYRLMLAAFILLS